MNCRQIRRYLSPYLDSELDATTTYEISRHLESCAECSRLFAEEQELERAIAQRLRQPQGDEQSVFERALARALPHPPRALPRWPLLAAGVLILALILFWQLVPHGQGTPDLLAMVAQDHAAYLRGEIEPELTASEADEVFPFLDSRLPQKVGGLPLRDGWTVEGARICSFRDAPIGFVMLRYRGELVSLAELLVAADEVPPKDVADASHEHCFELPGGRGVLGLTPCGLRPVFGNVEMAQLQEVLDAAR